MVVRVGAALFGGMLGLGVLALGVAAALPSPSRAQSADLVLCDRVAADPADPDKPGNIPGVREIAPSDVAIALKFCRSASASSRRALYQLGRAYAANKQIPEAIAAWRRAAERGSSTAMVELGVLHALGAGVPKDEAQARALFERAAKAGNPRGVTNLAALGGTAGARADPAQTRALLARAAETNSAEAQYTSARCSPTASAVRRTTPAHARCSRRRRCRTTPARSSGWARLRATAAAVRRMQTLPKPISNAPPPLVARTPRPRWSGCAAAG
jgi:hypothetical protein